MSSRQKTRRRWTACRRQARCRRWRAGGGRRAGSSPSSGSWPPGAGACPRCRRAGSTASAARGQNRQPSVPLPAEAGRRVRGRVRAAVAREVLLQLRAARTGNPQYPFQRKLAAGCGGVSALPSRGKYCFSCARPEQATLSTPYSGSWSPGAGACPRCRRAGSTASAARGQNRQPSVPLVAGCGGVPALPSRGKYCFSCARPEQATPHSHTRARSSSWPPGAGACPRCRRAGSTASAARARNSQIRRPSDVHFASARREALWLAAGSVPNVDMTSKKHTPEPSRTCRHQHALFAAHSCR